MRIDVNELKSFPEIMNKEQLCKACHISKKTALYLLKYNLIPHTDSGRQTRRYTIRKKDVIAFINDREVNPLKYIPPDYWYSRGEIKKVPGTIRILPNLPKDPAVIRSYYSEKLLRYPDVMDVADVVDFTGYNRRTVGGWIRTGKLKALQLLSKYVVPKPYLLDFLASDTYNQILRKTPLHVKMLWDLVKKNGGQPGRQEGGRK